MKRSFWFVVVVLISASGCDRSDGDRLARVGRKLTQKVQALIPDRTPFGTTLPLAKTGIDQRVEERFRLDAYLSRFQFDIAAEGSTIRLKGTVDDEVLKKRAIEIAESTVGVDKVIDEVVVGK